MGQSLKAKTDTDGEIEIAMQQYEIGLYVCIYKNGRMLDQFSLDTTEDEFIETLKNSTTIKLLPINKE
jgi:5-hydroxyisourate hydrolase-like protein (transthyretin family)